MTIRAFINFLFQMNGFLSNGNVQSVVIFRQIERIDSRNGFPGNLYVRRGGFSPPMVLEISFLGMEPL